VSGIADKMDERMVIKHGRGRQNQDVYLLADGTVKTHRGKLHIAPTLHQQNWIY